MNQLSCLFLSEDVFIINICNEYKSIGDQNLVSIIKSCINFNKELNSKNSQYLLDENKYLLPFNKYKGIVIVKNLEDFSSEYVIVNCYYKEASLSKEFKNLSLDKGNNNCNNNCNNNNNNNNNGQSDYDFMQFLKLHVQKHMFNINMEYYNSVFDGDKYHYCLNSCTKLDFDILIHNFLQIMDKESIENIEFILANRHHPI
jgi:hypothetical protein